MRAKISITLTEELLKAIDRRAKQQRATRSNFIEAAVQAFVRQLSRDEQNARDLEIINRNADSLNREACDVLEYSQR
jgi:metal-responsive CopG/Arc/MetJ family transcriptional regulator